MTHAERQALIRKPFFIETHGHSYRWAGVLIEDPEGERGLYWVTSTKYRLDKGDNPGFENVVRRLEDDDQ